MSDKIFFINRTGQDAYVLIGPNEPPSTVSGQWISNADKNSLTGIPVSGYDTYAVACFNAALLNEKPQNYWGDAQFIAYDVPPNAAVTLELSVTTKLPEDIEE